MVNITAIQGANVRFSGSCTVIEGKFPRKTSLDTLKEVAQVAGNIMGELAQSDIYTKNDPKEVQIFAKITGRQRIGVISPNTPANTKPKFRVEPAKLSVEIDLPNHYINIDENRKAKEKVLDLALRANSLFKTDQSLRSKGFRPEGRYEFGPGSFDTD